MASDVSTPAQDPMSAFFGRIRDFDPRARWKMDTFLEQLSRRRQTAINFPSMKKRIWRSAYMSSLHHGYVHNEHPALVANAGKFLDALDALLSGLRELQVDPEDVARVVENASVADLPRHSQHEVVSTETRALLEALRETEDRVRDYLTSHLVTESQPSSNRADHFVRSFVEMSAMAWRAEVLPQLERRRDRGDFVGLLGAALDDFGYPRSGKQIKSDRWLYDRVGGYGIWN